MCSPQQILLTSVSYGGKLQQLETHRDLAGRKELLRPGVADGRRECGMRKQRFESATSIGGQGWCGAEGREFFIERIPVGMRG
jgi:hypothetical protein